MTIFLSDTHFGLRSCRAGKLNEFLWKQDTNQKLILVGDIFDDHPLTRLPVEQFYSIQRMYAFKEIVYVPGNHDAFVRRFYGQWGHITICKDYQYQTADNRYYLVTHGDTYDVWTKYTGFITHSWIAKTSRYIFENFHTHLLANDGFRNALLDAAKQCGGMTGVICGHSHVPEFSKIDGLEYWNCGAWTEDKCSAIIEKDGKLELTFF